MAGIVVGDIEISTPDTTMPLRVGATLLINGDKYRVMKCTEIPRKGNHGILSRTCHIFTLVKVES